MKITTKHARNSPVTFVTQAFCSRLLSAVLLSKLTIVRRKIAHAAVKTSSIAMLHKKLWHEFAARAIRCVQTAYWLVDFIALGVSRIVIF